jgi:succinate dehydrogenase/fumarate reductase iron-sulfur protein
VKTRNPDRTVTLQVRRADASTPARPRWEAFRVAAGVKRTVLDALLQVQAEHQTAPAFRFSCGAKRCGTCALVINGREQLACGTLLDDLGDAIWLEPLRHLPIVKDLVVDMAPFFAKYAAALPYFVGNGATEPALVPRTARARDIIDQQLGCITCGACYSACPIVARDSEYLGPAALNRAYCLVADERDQATEIRLAAVATEDGIYRCHSVSNCQAVCPHQIEPMFSIHRLRQRALRAPRSGSPHR